MVQLLLRITSELTEHSVITKEIRIVTSMLYLVCVVIVVGAIKLVLCFQFALKVCATV